MSQHTINHACGHTTTQNLLGKNEDRLQKIHWWERVDCPKCFGEAKFAEKSAKIKEENEQAKLYKENIADISTLHGTEKQIEWADTIRISHLKYVTEKLEIKKDDELRQNILKNYRTFLLSKTEAKWWIENRQHNPLSLYQEWKSKNGEIK